MQIMRFGFSVLWKLAAVASISCLTLLVAVEAFAPTVSYSVEKPVEMRAFFNGEEATVVNITICAGQPCRLELFVDVETPLDYLVLCLYEPGGDKAYELLEGKSNIDVYDLSAGTELHYIWVVAPNGQWTGGLAPVQLFYSFQRAETGSYAVNGGSAVSGSFTFANPFIEKQGN